MSIDFFKRLFLLLILCVTQIFIFNHIQILGVATPLIYTFFIVSFPKYYPKWSILLWCFALGLIIDVFQNTMGVTCTTTTLLGLLQPYLLSALTQRDTSENFRPTLSSMGWIKYLYYASVITFLLCLMVVTLDIFNFFDPLEWLLKVVGCTLITLVMVIIFSLFGFERSDK